jgi:hypothetical protein
MKCIVGFSDIVKSSTLWREDEQAMSEALQEHEDIMRSTLHTHHFMVVKTIGDAFMFVAPAGVHPVKTILTVGKALIQETRKAKKRVKGKRIRIRIGMAWGEVEERRVQIQDCTMVDYFGSVVNLASRFESKVCRREGDAFAFGRAMEPNEEKVVDACDRRNVFFDQTINSPRLPSKSWCIEPHMFHQKKVPKSVTRSNRLLCILHRSADMLHGAGSARGYHVAYEEA